MFKTSISSGTAVGVHHLGGTGSAGLATATAIDSSLQKDIEANQKLWESVFTDLIGWMLTAMGFESERVEVTMPPILTRDFATLAQALAGAMKAVDPKVSSRELVRWYFGELLDAMGRTNTQELLDKFFPTTWVSPAAQEENLMKSLYGQQEGATGVGGGTAPPTLPPSEVAGEPAGPGFPQPGGYGLGTQAGSGQLSHKGPQDYFGGAVSAGGVKRDRAARRREIALQGAEMLRAADAPEELIEVIEAAFEEIELPELEAEVPVGGPQQ